MTNHHSTSTMHQPEAPAAPFANNDFAHNDATPLFPIEQILQRETFLQKTKRITKKIARFLGALGVGLTIASLTHLIGILILAFYIMAMDQPEKRISTDGALFVGIEDAPQTDSLIDIEIKSAGTNNPETIPLKLPTFIHETDIDITIPESVEALMKKIGDSGDKGDKGKGELPKGGTKHGHKVFTKENVTVWTIPEDPAVRQAYMLVIRIKIPKKFPEEVKNFPIMDISGHVQGNGELIINGRKLVDDHKQEIPFDEEYGGAKIRSQTNPKRIITLHQGSKIPIHKKGDERFIQFLIRVPGSKIPKTTDTIKIHSKMLNEEQSIQIVF